MWSTKTQGRRQVLCPSVADTIPLAVDIFLTTVLTGISVPYRKMQSSLSGLYCQRGWKALPNIWPLSLNDVKQGHLLSRKMDGVIIKYLCRLMQDACLHRVALKFNARGVQAQRGKKIKVNQEYFGKMNHLHLLFDTRLLMEYLQQNSTVLLVARQSPGSPRLLFSPSACAASVRSAIFFMLFTNVSGKWSIL